MNAIPDLLIPAQTDMTRAEFDEIAAIMLAEARNYMPPHKITLAQSRLARRMRRLNLPTWRAYIERVRQDEKERGELVIALTTNHTHFFREAHHYEDLAKRLLPQFRSGAQDSVRIWSAGCSTGEEVYSTAMTLLGDDMTSASWVRNTDVKLLATDISTPVVEKTRAAIYSTEAVAPIPPRQRSQWTVPHGPDEVRIADLPRSLVTAQILNLFGEWPMRRKFDIIFCRNVMIYFDDDAKSELTTRFANALKPGGTLYIGHSERLVGPDRNRFRPAGQTIYILEEGAR
jgi:chemotaxis protein methyltransferase CheR